MKRILLSIIALIAFSHWIYAQNVNIPDANFKAYLVNNAAINTNSDAEIQVSEATAYTGSISCANQGISDLTGIEAFVNITVLQAFGNPITGSIDLTQNTKITQLLLESTQIEGLLDLSTMTNLIDVKIHSTSIIAVNMANGNNTNVTRFEAQASTAECIQTDNGFTPGPSWIIPATANYSNTQCPQFCIVNIPDAAFKSYLLGNSAINTNSDSEIQCAEASAFTGMINSNGSGIADLTGVEAFTALTTLSVESNNLSSIDVSANTLLENLYCSYNNLSSLDVSSNTNLETIQCTNNSLTSLTIGSSNALTFINVIANDLTSFDFTNLTALEGFRCSGNQLTSLDLSSLSSLVQLFCDSNNLSSLNVANGNNANFWTSPGGGYLFLADGNPNLACIQVDDVAFSTTNWTSIDAASSFSTDCPVLVSSITVQGQGGASTITTNGGTLQMEAIVLPANADDATYTWSISSGGGNASLTSTGVLQALDNGTVTVAATANDGSFVQGFATITISNQGAQAVLVSSIIVDGQGGASSITTNGGVLQMEAAVLPMNADDATYTWSVVNGTGAATIDANGLLTATADGTVDVVATANDGSGITGTKMISISNQTVGIKGMALDFLKVYPNPTQGTLNIELQETLSSIRLISITGQQLAQFEASTRSIDISRFNKGIYFLELQNAEAKSIVKVILQ